MQQAMEDWNGTIIEPYGFTRITEHPYGPLGQCWQLSQDVGEGYFWAYGEQDLFDIKIHDFSLHKNTLVESAVPGYLSICYYDSVSGEQLSPYRRLNAGCIQSIAGNDTPYKIWIHKRILVHSIGLGITPAYYEQYMKRRFPDEQCNPCAAFAGLNQEEDFPELVLILKQVENYRGNGIPGKLFYQGKVDEVVSLLLSRLENRPLKSDDTEVSRQDRLQMEIAVSYINDHYPSNISLEQLCQISCMSVSKFKSTFKKAYGCPVTAYVQQRRLSHAECLLAESDLTIGQIAQSVGYTTSSRLAALFRESTGLTPAEYRKMARKK